MLLLRLRLRLFLPPLHSLLLVLSLGFRVPFSRGLLLFLGLHHDGGGRQGEREQNATGKSAGYPHPVSSIGPPLTHWGKPFRGKRNLPRTSSVDLPEA
jgi:hypothetical protein